jgi:putative ATPase
MRSSYSMDLFENAHISEEGPLAYRMRPRDLDEFKGQDHIVGPGRLLRRAIQADQLSSLIFFGPPGTGKTTLARIIANTTKSAFVTLNAVLSGVKDIREEIAAARERKDLYGTRTILFVDEVHRWNRAQQDALLPWVENGTFILIGATTENPYFEVNKALVSRSRIFQLVPLTEEDCLRIGREALKDPLRGYGNYSIDFDDDALHHLARIANGDARSMLNAIELAVETTPPVFPPPPTETIRITLAEAEESIQKKAVLYDKEGDFHYDIISAFIKSLRGSDPDAALYWLARMVRAGEDPKFLFRRMLILASEDVGMADPHALGVVEAAAAAFERVGLPEGRFHLTQAALYLATAPKSNSALGFFDALSHIEEEQDGEVPPRLKDANRDKEGFGHGEGYLYPHAYKDHWVPQQYLPRGLAGRVFYSPSDQGYEDSLREEVLRKRESSLEIMAEPDFDEVLTFGHEIPASTVWIGRTLDSRDHTTRSIHETIMELLALKRHYRVLVAAKGGGSLVWALIRRVPEGGVWVHPASEEQKELLLRYGETLPEYERPFFLSTPLKERAAELKQEGICFEGCVLQDQSTERLEELLPSLIDLFASRGTLVISHVLPSESQRLSQFFPSQAGEDLLSRVKKAEEALYTGETTGVPSEKDVSELLKGIQMDILPPRREEYQEERYIPPEVLQHWLNPHKNGSLYGKTLFETLGKEDFQRFNDIITAAIAGKTVSWRRKARYITAKTGK